MGEENSVLLLYMSDMRCGHGFRGYMLQLAIEDINNLDQEGVCGR